MGVPQALSHVCVQPHAVFSHATHGRNARELYWPLVRPKNGSKGQGSFARVWIFIDILFVSKAAIALLCTSMRKLLVDLAVLPWQYDGWHLPFDHVISIFFVCLSNGSPGWTPSARLVTFPEFAS